MILSVCQLVYRISFPIFDNFFDIIFPYLFMVLLRNAVLKSKCLSLLQIVLITTTHVYEIVSKLGSLLDTGETLTALSW